MLAPKDDGFKYCRWWGDDVWLADDVFLAFNVRVRVNNADWADTKSIYVCSYIHMVRVLIHRAGQST